MGKFHYCMITMLLLTSQVKSQNIVQPPGGGGGLFKPGNNQFAKMSEILPPAPDAAAIATYGGIAVDLSSGTIGKSIELRPFTHKALSVPVTLTYNSNGIKVNDYLQGLEWAGVY